MVAWRSIRVKAAPKYVISELSLQIFLKDFVHWIGYNPNEADSNFRDLSIVLFDMSNEVFEELKLPDSVSGLSVLDLSIFASSNELLSLVQYDRHRHSQWIQYGSCSIWVMKEYGKVESWTKQITIDLQGGVGKALGLIGNDVEMLLVACSNGELGSYDIQNQKISYLEIKGIVNSFYLDTYIETLILLDGDNGI
ncbi:hypothetical protein JCGZ_15487 [Jatropha curcas]|uniref:F-box associated beta-propeller type 1 domain-containing protein n=2 Tax=Jatropha curcas TaxID=180498 RepID=A0A067LBZ5_JATCU|nr:hypothetical protein JCGZ_15487 [Jatropha curcas]